MRIDYALVTPGLLGSVVSCEILTGLPPKWSDHAPLLLELRDIPDAPQHPPCAASSRRMKRFQAPKASIAALFAAQKRAAAADEGLAVGDGGSREQATAAKLPRHDNDADVATAAAGADPASAGGQPEEGSRAAVRGMPDADAKAGNALGDAAGRGEEEVGASGLVTCAAAGREGVTTEGGASQAAQRAGSGSGAGPKQPKQATPRKGKKGSMESAKADAKQRSIRSFFGPS